MKFVGNIADKKLTAYFMQKEEKKCLRIWLSDHVVHNHDSRTNVRTQLTIVQCMINDIIFLSLYFILFFIS